MLLTVSCLACSFTVVGTETLAFRPALYVADMAEQYVLQGLSGPSAAYSSPTHLVPKDKLSAPHGTYPRRTEADMEQVWSRCKCLLHHTRTGRQLLPCLGVRVKQPECKVPGLQLHETSTGMHD